jgi:hypothetical protein
MPQQSFAQPPFNGRKSVESFFGPVVVRDGEIVEPHGWESKYLTKIPSLPGWAPARGVYLAKAVVEPAVALFTRWQELQASVPFEIKRVGFFAPRSKRGYPLLLSLHTYAIAFDLNPDDNPMQQPGEKVKTTIPLAWIAAAKALGWTWGGEFSRPDPMHFQWASGV